MALREEAGFKKFDEILQVDGKDARKTGVHNLKGILKGREGKIIRIKIKRKGKEKIIKLRLKTYI